MAWSVPRPVCLGGGRVWCINGPGGAGQVWKGRVVATADRQEIEVVGLSHPVAFALDRPVALELPPTNGEGLLTLELEPRFSGEAALRDVRGGRTCAVAG